MAIGFTGDIDSLRDLCSTLFDILMNPATKLPIEWDSDDGGVLTMLPEPMVVEASVDEMDEEEDEVDGDVRLTCVRDA